MRGERRDQLLIHADLVRELCARSGGAWITCAGSSMEPTIARGARVRVIAASRARVGDVALLASGEHLVMHRIVARVPTPRGAILIHAGDAGGRAGLVGEARLVGRVLSPRRPPPLTHRLRALGVALGRRVAARVRAAMG